MFDPYQPPRGWQVVSGLLEPDRSVAGYFARGQEVTGRCYQRDCRRTCSLDIQRLHAKGLGKLGIDQIKRSMRCNRIDLCALDFHEDMKAESLKLRDLTGRSAVAVRVSCRSCKFNRTVAPEVMIARLKKEGKGGDETETRDLARLMSAPCKACRKTSWEVSVVWPDPNTIGGRQAIERAVAAAPRLVNPLEF